MLIFDVVIAMIILSGISMAFLGLYGWRFADRIPAAVPYTLLMASAAAWAILYSLELMTPSLPLKIVFHNLRFLFLPFVAVIELWLVIAYVKKTEWLRRDWAAAVLIIPVIAAFLGTTSPFHTLFRYNFSINTAGPVMVLQYTDSPFYTLYIFYSLVLLILAIVILIVESRKRKTLWEEQTIILLTALALPTIINYLFIFGITPLPGVNMTAPLFWIAAVLYTVALFRYRFLDIIPIARSRLIETMSTPMLVLDMGGRIIDLNPAACSLFATTLKAAVGKSVDGIAPDWPDFLSLCRSDETDHADLTRDQEGGARYYTGSVELIHTSSGEPEGRLVLLQDVTGQKNAERALRFSEEKFRKAFYTSPDAICISRLEDGMFVSVNKGFLDLSGYTEGEIIGRTSLERNIWKDKDDRDRVTRALISGEEVVNYEARFTTRDREIVGLVSASVIIINGTSHILTITRDITGRKQVEEAKDLLLEELGLKNAELDRFTYTISHDLKSPLITIRGFLGLLGQDLKKNDPSLVQKDMDRISSAAEKMERLISTLLALSRSGKSVDSPEYIPLTGLVQEAAGLLDVSLKNQGVTLTVAEDLTVVSGDRQSLLQVMTNLLENAIKFMGDQKEPRIDVGVRQEDAGPVFFVRDNGMGIRKEDQPKIFGLFERLYPEIPGTGIGLATVKRIIEAHGGKIWVESEGAGEGTTFWFTLPGNPKDRNSSARD
ncbi:MAG: PAS domain S-box protein [Methanoregula sp.]|nr:PAS domain S-box protein [Methanoregula sp.]